VRRSQTEIGNEDDADRFSREQMRPLGVRAIRFFSITETQGSQWTRRKGKGTMFGWGKRRPVPSVQLAGLRWKLARAGCQWKNGGFGPRARLVPRGLALAGVTRAQVVTYECATG
jgi:hypothetical protein